MRIKYRKQNSELRRLTGEIYGEVQAYEEDGREFVVYTWLDLSKVLIRLNGFCRSWKDIYYHKDDICCYIADNIGSSLDIIFSRNGSDRYNNNWKKTRELAVSRDCGKCVGCGEADYLTVHHINNNSRDDSLKNLKTLCWKCHSYEHPHMQKTPPRTWRPW